MHTRRTNAVKELKDLAEELTKSLELSSRRTLEEDLSQICTWVNTDCWIEANKSKVRKQLTLSCTRAPLIHLVFFSYLWQASQLKKKLLDLLNSVIAQDATLSRDLASYQTWSDCYGHNVSLNEIAVKLERAIAEVSDYFFDLEIVD